MNTVHQVHFTSATAMNELDAGSVALVVTSPPYPMIAMWDDSFAAQDPEIGAALEAGDGRAAFERMHSVLDMVWAECARVLRPGGFACVNIGDATRTLGGGFRLYTNHARITLALEALGMESLPLILWRKQTNAPNKFMGSGMLPAGAYVTLEHEYILVLRKGGKREFTPEERALRRASAFFWEERNTWCSDLWDFKGTRQLLSDADARARSGAFPFELAWRLVQMYSLQGDTVLDPFLGTGTTAAACLACARSSVGYELAPELSGAITQTMQNAALTANRLVSDRFQRHFQFLQDREAGGTPPAHTNAVYGFPVMTKQEVEMRLLKLDRFTADAPGRFTGEHSPATPDAAAAPNAAPTALAGAVAAAGESEQLSFGFKT